MSNRPDYNLVVFAENDDKDKPSYSVTVGAAWRNKSGVGLTLRIHPGVSVSGTVALLPPKERNSGR